MAAWTNANRNRYAGEFGLFIDGEFRAARSGKLFAVENPADCCTFAQVAEGDAADIDDAMEAATRAARTGPWPRMHPLERQAVLNRFADLLEVNMERLVYLEVGSTGRPIRELSAQLAEAPRWFRYFAAAMVTHEGSVTPFKGDHLNYIYHVPLGVVGHVTPWNHPLFIATKKLAPALATGNCVVQKPSELAPLTALEMARLATEAGLPGGVYNVVPGFGPTAGARLSGHPGIRKLDLTGGTETGKQAAATAGRNLNRLTMELGGKAPVLIFPDVDVKEAAAGAAFSSFVAAGQTCIQGSRHLVHRSIHTEFVRELTEIADRLRLGDPFDWSTQMGPVASAHQFDRVMGYLAIGRAEGAVVAAGGSARADLPGYYIAPTVFTHVQPKMRIAQEEIFGPVTCVIPFDTEEEAIGIANDVKFGLAAGIWTNDIKRAHRVARAMEAGTVWVNDHHRNDPASPWGGFKESGVGRENGLHCLLDYLEAKAVIVNLGAAPAWFTSDKPQRLN
ncbi:MAG: aldehyde dehydrogenase [Firmicutes bacterium]|nr:aldehyde dehydrogenase [Bacillota bacterium]